MEHKNRYDAKGNYDEHGRYDESGNYIYTWSERKIALIVGVALLAATHLWGPVLDELPYRRVVDGILGFAIVFALWVAVVGRISKDPD